MIPQSFKEKLAGELSAIESAGLTKHERIIAGAQSAWVHLEDGRRVLNLCANNYLGLADNPQIIEAAHASLNSHGFGLASVRFICGTQDQHTLLERKVAEFLGMEDSILYASCFDANGGLFETLLNVEDAVISDTLNHASIIDGIRLCKAQRFRYAHNDMADLESKLKDSAACRTRMIATDGVFSMDGTIANLPAICDLAEKYDALVMIDDCHATGFLGTTGRGTPEYRNVVGRVDIITSTLGKALGGASGGFTAASKEIIQLLRQRSRPYLFSNTLAPSIVGGSLKVLELLEKSDALRRHLMENTRYFRDKMESLGFEIRKGEHPIVPIMIGDAVKAGNMAASLLEKGVYVVAFSYPVVPKDTARIRVQMSAAHSREDLDFALEAFASL